MLETFLKEIIRNFELFSMSRRPEWNRRPTVYDTVALPAELRRPKAGNGNRTRRLSLGRIHITTILYPPAFRAHPFTH